MITSSDIAKINYDITNDGHVISQNMIDSALSSYHYYDDVKEQVVSIFRGIIKNHAFRDGNKRTGLIVLLTLCNENDININKTDEELAKLTIDVANNKYEIKEIVDKLFNVDCADCGKPTDKPTYWMNTSARCKECHNKRMGIK